MEKAIALLAISFTACFIIIKLLKPLAYWAELVDKPGGRKDHKGVIPLIGGLAIYAAVSISTFFFIDQPLFIRLFLLAGGLIVFMGMVDDRYELSARFRLVGQLLVCGIFVYGLDIRITNFGNLFGMGDITVGWLGYPLTVLSLMGVMNAFNMMDGMDGLVGSLCLVVFAGLAYLFCQSSNVVPEFLCLTFVGAISAFLIFNIWGSPGGNRLRKIFMGDAGSMFLGLCIGVLVVYGAQNPIRSFEPITALWFVLLPMTDMFTIMYRRVKRGRSPMAPDRTHIHHILLRAGYSRSDALCILVLAQSGCVVLGIVLAGDALLSIAFALILVALYQYFLKRSWRFIRWKKRCSSVC
ncbi:MraY family glycosyltransferase [Agaribacterium haliotis]|uniref:MraY family glycosyltransferase n=1 Tax=Agaribacterium haliotis TaxID=2013869 RepID=UPI000BB5334C|nr:MraY family glycosyltransferase [Agaribacterium haliotis]